MALDDIKDAGELIEVVRYGIGWHGRIEGGVLYTGLLDGDSNEITRIWPQPADGTCRLIQVPQTEVVDDVEVIIPGTTLPDPYAGNAAQKAADAAEGLELTNYALLSGHGDIHGKPPLITHDWKDRWLWVDDHGQVWSVQFGQAGTLIPWGTDEWGLPIGDYDYTADITARFSITRFGVLVEDGTPAATPAVFTHTIPGNSLGQSTPALSGVAGCTLHLIDVSTRGHKLLFELVCTKVASNLSLGYVQFSFSGPGAAPTIAMSVIANRAVTLGTVERTGTQRDAVTPQSCVLVGDPGFWVSGGGNIVLELNQTVTYDGRILSMQFDASDTPVAITMGATIVTTQNVDTDYVFDTMTGDESYVTTDTVTSTGSATVTAGINVSSADVAVESVLNAAGSVTGGSGSGWVCTRNWTHTSSGMGTTPTGGSGSDGYCESPMDHGYVCNAVDTTVALAPLTSTEMMRYEAPLGISVFYFFGPQRKVGAFRRSSPALWAAWGIEVAGCVGLNAAAAYQHQANEAVHWSYNPATGELVRRGWAVNFT